MTEVGCWRDQAACRDLVTADHDPFFADTVAGQSQQIIRRLIAADRAGRPQARRTPAGHPQASKTHCKRGHQFTADNTYYTPDGHRRCRTCLREAQPIRASKGGGSDVA